MARKAVKRETIVDQLRSAIRESGLTTYRLAKLAGVGRPGIDWFLSGERDLRMETAAKLAAALGMSLAGFPSWMSSTYPVTHAGKRQIALLFSTGHRLLRFIATVPGSAKSEHKPGRLLAHDMREHLRDLKHNGAGYVAFDYDGESAIEAFEIDNVIEAISDQAIFDRAALGPSVFIETKKAKP